MARSAEPMREAPMREAPMREAPMREAPRFAVSGSPCAAPSSSLALGVSARTV
jgi:hypothetical protein